jgi:hypothetical protein
MCGDRFDQTCRDNQYIQAQVDGIGVLTPDPSVSQ